VNFSGSGREDFGLLDEDEEEDEGGYTEDEAYTERACWRES
jgi:hypothetical protein